MKDPRRTEKGNLRHALPDILFLMVCAVISGMHSWPAVELFGQQKLDWLRRYFPYGNGIPSPDTLSRFFGALDPAGFSGCFIDWAAGCLEPLEGEVISIDGKRIRGSGGKQGQQEAIHMVSAFAAKNRLTLGQLAVFEKSNEITVIPELMELIDVKGDMVSIDAMGCQRDIAGLILEKQADYLLAVKGNQDELQQQVEKLFAIRTPCDSDTTVDAGHGRVETRRCDIIGELRFLDLDQPWPGLRSIVRIRSHRYFKKDGKQENQTRYYISSAEKTARYFNEAVRNHWAIENNLHWELDVLFGEDAAQRKNRNAVKNFNTITKICLRLVEKYDNKPTAKRKKLSKNRKMMSAAMSDHVREQMIGFF